MNAAEDGGGAVFTLLEGVDTVAAAAFGFGVPGPGAAPTGALPLKQLSHTFCWAVLLIWGRIIFFWRWSEHTTLPHFLQW